jgi:hypothetical protein
MESMDIEKNFVLRMLKQAHEDKFEDNEVVSIYALSIYQHLFSFVLPYFTL